MSFLMAAGLGLSAYGMFGKRKTGAQYKPDYSRVDSQYAARQSQIASFAQNLASSRARYMTSLNNLYNDAYTRFSGNAEAGFASRGLSVSGGAFASTLAKEAGRMSFEGANIGAGMEREDIRSIDGAYGANSNAYMGSLGQLASGGLNASVAAASEDRQDIRSMGSFAGSLAMRYMGNRQDPYGNKWGSTYGTDYSSPVMDYNSMTRDNPLGLLR